jgi:hypothetical protein
MDNPHYCETGWSLWHKLAETFCNLETGEDYPPEMFGEMEEKGKACDSALQEHLQACVQCSTEEYRFKKKRAAPVQGLD